MFFQCIWRHTSFVNTTNGGGQGFAGALTLRDSCSGAYQEPAWSAKRGGRAHANWLVDIGWLHRLLGLEKQTTPGSSKHNHDAKSLGLVGQVAQKTFIWSDWRIQVVPGRSMIQTETEANTHTHTLVIAGTFDFGCFFGQDTRVVSVASLDAPTSACARYAKSDRLEAGIRLHA